MINVGLATKPKSWRKQPHQHPWGGDPVELQPYKKTTQYTRAHC